RFVHEQAVFFVASIRLSSAVKFVGRGLEIKIQRGIKPGTRRVDVVTPELGLVIPGGRPALMTVDDVNVQVAIIVEIERSRTPGPAGPRDLVAQLGLFEFVSPGKIHSI